MRRLQVLTLFLAVAGLAPTALAQSSVTGEFSVQRLHPAPGPHNMMAARGARPGEQFTWSVGTLANYGSEPFVVISRSGGQETDVRVVEHLATVDFMGSFNPAERLQLGLRVPLNYVEGDGITPQGSANFTGGIDGPALGDPELEAKMAFYGQHKDPIAVGAAAFLRAPLGKALNEGNFVGDDQPAFGLRAIFDALRGPVNVLANVGYTFRGDGTVGLPPDGTDEGNELGYNVGVGFAFSPIIRVFAEGFGTTQFTSDPGANSLEIGGGLQISPSRTPLVFTAGGTGGVVQGIGVPLFRAVLGIGVYIEASERDGDGIEDADDACPTVAEDRDGFEDDDGCPDADNDGDTISDEADKCPNDPEDPDGFQDLDGCPEPDNDKDGLPDANDRCPLEPETMNKFRDDDGCPDTPDGDADGVSDTDDKCPAEAEDTDGFDDTDGCPDLDNDQDGIPDASDECVDEAETKNGKQDTDGCPD